MRGGPLGLLRLSNALARYAHSLVRKFLDALEIRIGEGTTWYCMSLELGRVHMQTLLLTVVMTLCLTLNAAAEEPVVTEWRDLWNRCRMAIEAGQRPDVSGLDDLGFSYQLVPPVLHPELGPLSPFFGGFVQEQRWGLKDGRFVIAETELTQGHVKYIPMCKIYLADESRPITESEEVLLGDAFKADRSTLVATNRYEVWDPDPIATTNLGLRQFESTPNGFRAVSSLFIANGGTTEPWFSLLNGEQGGDCSSSSPRFSWPGQSPLFSGNAEALVREVNRIADAAGSEVPLNAPLTRCLQRTLVVCHFVANDGGIMGVTQAADNTSPIWSLIVQTPYDNQQIGAFLATVGATMELVAKEAPPEQRRDALLTIARAVRDRRRHVQVEINGVFWILESNSVAINAGVIRS